MASLWASTAGPRANYYRRYLSPEHTEVKTINRKRNTSYHKMLFILVAASFTQNLNTSLLTREVFKCENFSTDCRTAYMFGGILSFLSSLLITQNLLNTLFIYGAAIFCHIGYIILASYASGEVGRILYTAFYALQGVLNPLMVQACKCIISAYFVRDLTGFVATGWTMGDVISGCLQGIITWRIGCDTILKTRLCLMLCLAAQILLSVIGWLWLLYLYIQWNDLAAKTDEHECRRKIKRLKAMVIHIPKVFPRLFFILLANGSRYFFYPTLIPFQLPIKDHDMLVISIAEGLCYFLGSVYAVDANEEIDDKKRKTNMSHILFILLQNAHLYALIAIIWVYNVLTISVVWTRGLRYIESPMCMLVCTIVQAFATGYLCTRGYDGCFPILKYYNRQGGSDDISLPSECEFVSPSLLWETLYGFDVTFSAFLSLLCMVFDTFINAHKGTIPYILMNNAGPLSHEDVRILLSKHK